MNTMQRSALALIALAAPIASLIVAAPAGASAPHGHAWGWSHHHAAVSTTTAPADTRVCFFAVSGNCLIWR